LFVAFAAVVIIVAVWAIRLVIQWMSTGAVKDAFVDIVVAAAGWQFSLR
jgi:hypothetical protein